MSGSVFDRYWRIRTNLPERHGQRLRVLARGGMNSAWIEFEDGVQHIVSRNSFRKLFPDKEIENGTHIPR